MTQTEKILAHYAVMRSLERSPQTFKQLLESCHSLFPDQLASLLDEMEINRLVQRDGEKYMLDGSIPNRWRRLYADWNENIDRAYTSLSAIMGRIHLPHCLDYEWWFTHSGREKVAELLLHDNPLPTPESIVFLGSPLFGAFASALCPESKIYIYISPELLDFADGNIALPTVSRRDPIRKEIDLWTSTQHGFKIKGWKAIWKIVEGIRDNLSLEGIFENIRREYPNTTIPESEKPAVEKVWCELRSYLGG